MIEKVMGHQNGFDGNYMKNKKIKV